MAIFKWNLIRRTIPYKGLDFIVYEVLSRLVGLSLPASGKWEKSHGHALPARGGQRKRETPTDEKWPWDLGALNQPLYFPDLPGHCSFHSIEYLSL